MKLGVFIEKFLSRCDDIKIQQLFSNIETNVICLATEEGQKVVDKYKDKIVHKIFPVCYRDRGRESAYICIVLED